MSTAIRAYPGESDDPGTLEPVGSHRLSLAMHALTITDLEGTCMISSLGELATALERRFDGGANHFMIVPAGAMYPMLDVLVRNDDAVLHYFETDGSAPSQSLSHCAGTAAEVLFPANLTFELIQLPGSTRIDTAAATRCVEQFAVQLARPSLIDWIEL